MRRLAAAVLIAAAFGLAGCSVNPATGERSFTAFMSPAEEARVGAAEHPKLVAEFGGAYDDPQLADYVDAVGQRLARVSEAPGVGYTFTVLNDEKVNAFALPGGYIHVARGLLALAGSEAEMAAVLAHEIGHVVARHSAERYSQTVMAQLGLALLGVVGSAAGAPSSLGDIAAFGAQAYLQGYSREQELEADMLGLRYMARAGYDPSAMVTFFRKLDRHTSLEARLAGDPGAADRFSIMASHPRTGDRVVQAMRLVGTVPATGAAVGTERYLAQIDGLLYGDHPSQGVRLGRDFLHPELAIAFQVPSGFVMFNGPRQVVARGPDGAMIAFDMVDPRVARQETSVADYVGGTWGGRLQLAGLERLDVGGLEGATGVARLRTSDGVQDVRLVAIRERAERIYRFLFVAPAAQAAALADDFRRTTYSFRRLSADEAASIRPLTVRVFSAVAGDTPESLARRMAVGDNRLERFLALNGLEAGARLAPGQPVKLVVPE